MVARISERTKNKVLATRHALDVQQKQKFLIAAASNDLALARLLVQRFKREP